jgi:hypothetical protein
MIPLLNFQSKPLYYLRRISDKFVINARAISNTIPPAEPNPGPDQEYIPIYIEDPAPDFDPAYTIRTQTEGVNETDHQVQITYSVADRPLLDKIQVAANARRAQTEKQFPRVDASDALVLTLAAVLRASKGLELTPVEQVYADKLVAIAAALQKNADNEAALKAAIEAGQKPDPTTGWEPVAAVAVTP